MFNEIVGTFLAGFGLFLIALQILENCMHDLTSGSVRTILKKNTSTDFKASIWGAIMGFGISDPAVVACIAGSLYSGKSITLRHAMLMSLWSNVGACFILFIFFLNINVAVLFILGISAVLYYYKKPFKWRYGIGCIFSIALILYSLQLMNSQSDEFLQVSWIKDNTHYIQYSNFISFIFAAIAMIIFQTNMIIFVMIASFVLAHVITMDQAIIMLYGVQFGHAFVVIMMGLNFKGYTKQVIYMQALVDITISIFFYLLLIIETHTGIPMIKALSLYLGSTPLTQLIFVLLFANIIMTTIFHLFVTPISALLGQLFPPPKDESLSTPQYIGNASTQDPLTAIDLIEQELLGLMKRLPALIEEKLSNSLNEADKNVKFLETHIAFGSIIKEIEELMNEIQKNTIAPKTANRLVTIADRIQIVISLEEGVYQLTQVEIPQNFSEKLKTLYAQILESQEALIQTVNDAIEFLSDEDIAILIAATAHTNEVLNNVQKTFCEESPGLSVAEKSCVLATTSVFDRNVWLLRRLIFQFIPKGFHPPNLVNI